MDTLFASANFWVLISFIGFFAILGKRLFLMITNAIDERTNTIRHQLDEADRLQKEAAKLLKTYQKKHDDAVDQSIKIVSHAEQEAIEFQRTSERDLQKFMELKEKAMTERLELAKEEAIRDLRNEVLRESFRMVETILAEDTSLQKNLSDKALGDLESISLQKVG